MRVLVVLTLFVSVHASAEPPQSPYKIVWSFPGDDLSAIDVDRGDVSQSRFESVFVLVKYLGTLPVQKKLRRSVDGVPMREIRVDQLDSEGHARTTIKYVATLVEWRKRLGEPMVERLEDEFDAHLRMILPRKATPKPAEPE